VRTSHADFPQADVKVGNQAAVKTRKVVCTLRINRATIVGVAGYGQVKKLEAD